MRTPTAEQFIKDTAAHCMGIAHDDAVYRHLRFKSSNCGWNQWFDLTTWPGMLTISGDMGTWTFARLPDMFDFFRSSKGLAINPSYWAEKLQHGNFSGRQGGKVFDSDAFAERLLDQINNYYSLEDGERETVTVAVKEGIFEREDGNGQHALMNAAAEFECALGDRTFRFDPCALPDGMEYSFHFIWCLYAIVWGIQQYDAVKSTEPRNAA